MMQWRETRIVEAEWPTEWRRYPTGMSLGITPCGQHAVWDGGHVILARTLRGAYAASHGVPATLDAVADALLSDEAAVWSPGSQWACVEGGAE